MSENQSFDLDADLDDIADLVSYSNPADGVHIFGLAFAGMDAIGDVRGVRIIYQKIATIELADQEAEDSAVGSLFSEQFTGNDMGMKLLKLRLKQFFGEEVKGSFGPYIEQLGKFTPKDCQVQIVSKIHTSQGKGDRKGQTFHNVRITSLEPLAETMPLPDSFECYEHTPAEEE